MGNQQQNKVNKPAGNSLKEKDKRRRQVFKPVLDNPFTQVNWPFIQPNLSQDIIQHLTLILKPVGEYNEALAKNKTDNSFKVPDIPLAYENTVTGFNNTTQALEAQAKIKSSSLSSSSKNPVSYVFICKHDISPSILTAHFPTLVYTASQGCGQPIKLIQLPKGSMADLSQALSVEKTSILGLRRNIPEASALFQLLDANVTDISIPYLNAYYEDQKKYHSPRITFLETSAPILPSKNKKQKEKKDTKDTKN